MVKTQFSVQLSRQDKRRERRRDTDRTLQAAMRLHRIRKAESDRLATLEYETRKKLPVVDQVTCDNEFCEPDELAEWAFTERDHQRKLADDRRQQYRDSHLAMIVARQEYDEQSATFARAARMLAEPRFQPAPEQKPIEPELSPVPIEAIGQEILTLLESVKPSDQLEIASYCWTLSADHPDWTAQRTFDRARSILRNERRGRYVDDSHGTHDVRETQGNGAPTSIEWQSWQACANYAYDQETLQRYDSADRHDELEERMRLMAIVDDTLDPMIKAGLQSDCTVETIAEMIGRSVSFVYARIAAIREALLRAKRLPTVWTRAGGQRVTIHRERELSASWDSVTT